MGNVSYLVPSIHPMIEVAPVRPARSTRPSSPTTPGRRAGDQAVVDGAMAMAWTVADLWLGDGVLDAVQAEFAATMDRVGGGARRSAIAEVGGA